MLLLPAMGKLSVSRWSWPQGGSNVTRNNRITAKNGSPVGIRGVCRQRKIDPVFFDSVKRSSASLRKRYFGTQVSHIHYFIILTFFECSCRLTKGVYRVYTDNGKKFFFFERIASHASAIFMDNFKRIYHANNKERKRKRKNCFI